MGDILVIAGTVCYVQATCYSVGKNEEGKKYTGVKRTFHISLVPSWSAHQHKDDFDLKIEVEGLN